jgi:preprotein translocase subunit YajC
MTFASLILFAPPPGGTGGGSFMGPIFMYGAIFAIFYFILIRPQQKQRKAHEEMIKTLKKGDNIVTAGGVIGEVVHIKESATDGKSAATLDDQVTITSAGTRLIVERGRIAKVTRTDLGTNPA